MVDASMIRQRYQSALDRGMSIGDATAFANGIAAPTRKPGKLDPPGAPPRPQLDHDRDGRPGGSKSPADPRDELPPLRAEYQKTFGKRPFNGWDAAELRRRMAEA